MLTTLNLNPCPQIPRGPSIIFYVAVCSLSHPLLVIYFILSTHSAHLQRPHSADGHASHFTEEMKQLEESFPDTLANSHTLIVGFPECYYGGTAQAFRGNPACASDWNPLSSLWEQDSSNFPPFCPHHQVSFSPVWLSWTHKPALICPNIIYSLSFSPNYLSAYGLISLLPFPVKFLEFSTLEDTVSKAFPTFLR